MANRFKDFIDRHLRPKQLILAFLGGLCVFLLLALSLSYYINTSNERYIFDSADELPEVYTVIVLGASVKGDGQMSTVLRDRVQSALSLYERGKVKRFLLSGDNGTNQYNEPKAMRRYLLEHGVPAEDVFVDYAGFDTYDSIYRASYIFGVERAIVVSQRFHLPRALYIARSRGLEYFGYNGDRRTYELESRNRMREVLANIKAWGELLINKNPHFKGEKIPITGKNNI